MRVHSHQLQHSLSRFVVPATLHNIGHLQSAKRNRNEAKRNDTKSTKTKRNETKRNETKSTKTKRNETKRNQQKRNETKRNEINEMKTK